MVDDILINWVENSNVQVISTLFQAGSVYTCEEWGELGEPEIPIMIDGNELYLWFMTNGFPDYAILNQNMEVIAKPGYLDVEYINVTIENALENCAECTDNLSGDVNEDGILNVLDVVIIVNLILTNGFNDNADLNNDNSLNVLDIVQLVNLILG
ncbi:MAG: hypothetical protein H8E72_06640 [Candidatus Marinimicrobia bacterium]|nr:hypothetical protein [Candidatus Neomarinimicrobiota bacterium]